MDDRPIEEPAAAIGRIDADLADFKATVLARINRKPVGDIELAFRASPKEGTIFLQGQTLNRADYPALWEWAQASGSVVTGGYTVGNGTTTFGVPDMRNRFLVGAGGTVVLGGTGGSSSIALTVANMPAHDHNVGGSTGSDSHSHSGSTSGAGGHLGHSPFGELLVPEGVHYGVPPWNHGGSNLGSHDHSFDTSSDAHTHSLSITESSVGSGTAFDPRPPYLGINVAVWF